MEEGVQTTLWVLGLFHNETLCAFEAHFTWEPAKLSSKVVTLKDFHIAVSPCSYLTQICSRCRCTAVWTPHINCIMGHHMWKCYLPHMKWRAQQQLLTMQNVQLGENVSLYGSRVRDESPCSLWVLSNLQTCYLAGSDSSASTSSYWCCCLQNVLLYCGLEMEMHAA